MPLLRTREAGSAVQEARHAVADFLGNLSIVSLNECDECNAFFGEGCEDDLSKATLLLRTHAGIPRKDSAKSTFKDKVRDETLRIDRDGHAVNIRVPEPHSVDDLLTDGELPDEITLRGDLRSQPYVPIEAAKALVKFACAVCPKEELGQCRGAVDWVRGRREERFAAFPVGFAFTPGVEGLGDRASHAILLRRKDDGPEPYSWFVVQFRNFRFQVAVPPCPADAGAARTRREHFQSLFPPDWPRGATTFTWLDWSRTEKERTSWKVSHHREETIAITRPGE